MGKNTILALICGLVTGAGAMDTYIQATGPRYTQIGDGYIYQHVKYPSCPDGMFRKVEIPERDEVDMLTIYCVEPLKSDLPDFGEIQPEEQ